MLDSAYSPPTSTTDAEIQRKLMNFQGYARVIKKRANKDNAATEHDANKGRIQKLRAN